MLIPALVEQDRWPEEMAVAPIAIEDMNSRIVDGFGMGRGYLGFGRGRITRVDAFAVRDNADARPLCITVGRARHLQDGADSHRDTSDRLLLIEIHVLLIHADLPVP